MKKTDRQAWFIPAIVMALGLFMAWATSRNGIVVHGIPLAGLLIGLAFVIQWLAFIPAFIFQTEKFYDLTGSMTYLTIIILAVLFNAERDGRSLLLAVLVAVWALRLGAFLFTRIHRSGKDDRFADIKPSFIRFFNAWSLQGLWVTFTVAAALTAITGTQRREWDVFCIFGLLLWLGGFALESLADQQKSRFSAQAANSGRFITTGLWSRSRHPNYFGEIMLWIGIAVIALPVLRGWQWITLLSPVFVILLLTHVSGIPLLEKRADKKWGGQAEYEAYKKRTPVLIPRL